MARRSKLDSNGSVPADDDDDVDWDLTSQVPGAGLFHPATYDGKRLKEQTRTAVIVLLVVLGSAVAAITAVWCSTVELGVFIVSTQAGLCTLALKWYFGGKQ